jgi:hypothetical protein
LLQASFINANLKYLSDSIFRTEQTKNAEQFSDRNEKQLFKEFNYPIEPGLYSLLLEAFSAASEREQLVIPRNSIRCSNLWRDFGVICKRAKLERWAKWCHVLRKNCKTDWAQRFPQYVVSAWSGHSIEVSARYYLQVPEQLYKEASASKSLQDATKCHTAGQP